jgi:hypothetical protein
MSHTVTEKQLAANRANAQHSTGPRTSDGKARSAQNARSHGLRCETHSVFHLEDQGQLAELQAGAFAVYQPVNQQEVFAVERIALCQLTLLRAQRFETGLFIASLNAALLHPESPLFALRHGLTESRTDTVHQNLNYAIADGLDRLDKGEIHFALMLRYQAQAERQYRRAVEEFDRLKRLRPELPNEPVYTFQPPVPEPVNPQPNEPIDPWDEPVPAPQPAVPPSPDPAPLTPDPGSLTPAARSDASPAKIGLLPQITNHEIWRHRLSRKQLRSRRVLRRLQQPRAEGRIHLARFPHTGRR